jgi:uncharacterized NAD(P)/FAD-binding protein YdhS
LKDFNKLEFVKGRFSSAEIAGGSIRFSYTDSSGSTIRYPDPFHVAVNCTGSEKLDESLCPLIANMLKHGLSKMNLSERGFVVNENFETAPGLYIMGPLLGGNYNKLIHFWHLENAPRIRYLAPFLAKVLLNTQ